MKGSSGVGAQLTRDERAHLQICWNTEVFRTGTQAYGALEEVVREDMGGAEVDVLAFLIG